MVTKEKAPAVGAKKAGSQRRAPACTGGNTHDPLKEVPRHEQRINSWHFPAA